MKRESSAATEDLHKWLTETVSKLGPMDNKIDANFHKLEGLINKTKARIGGLESMATETQLSAMAQIQKLTSTVKSDRDKDNEAQHEENVKFRKQLKDHSCSIRELESKHLTTSNNIEVIFGMMKEKLSKKDIKIFQDKIENIPTHEDFVDTKNYVDISIENFRVQVDKACNRVTESMEIIARYDQVLTLKAQKYDLQQLENDFKKRLTELKVAGEQADIKINSYVEILHDMSS
jgi:hypothetical protein